MLETIVILFVIFSLCCAILTFLALLNRIQTKIVVFGYSLFVLFIVGAYCYLSLAIQ